MEKPIGDRFKFFATAAQKFVEQNIIEREQREENMRKLSYAFENFTKRDAERSKIRPVGVQVKKLAHFKGELPKYQSSLASGFDVRAQVSESIQLEPGQRVLIPTGLSFAIPEGYEIQARPRSGWAIRDGITLVNTPGTIDADYRGEVKVILINHGGQTVTVSNQDRVCQLVLAPVVQARLLEVDTLDATERGAGGFGSTGKA